MLTVVGGLKSAAGVTTVAVVRGFCRSATVVEADPAGGDVAGWWVWPDTGLSDLASAVVRNGHPQVGAFARTTSFGVPVVAAPLMPQGAAGSVAELVEVVPKLATDTDLVVDVGRVDPHAVTGRLVEAADLVVLVVTPVAGELARLLVMHGRLRQMCGDRLRVVLSQASPGGVPRFAAGEVARTVGCPVAGIVPFDPRTAGAVATVNGQLPRGRLRWWGRWRWPLLEAVNRI